MVQLYLVYQLSFFAPFCIFLLKIHYFLMLLVVKVYLFLAIIVLSLKRSTEMSTEKSLGIGCLPYATFETSILGKSCIAKIKIIKALEKKSIKEWALRLFTIKMHPRSSQEFEVYCTS